MIKAHALDRESYDVRSSGDQRKRVDAYYVEYDCPADKFNPERHIWICRFEVPRGGKFQMQDYPDKKTAIDSRGFTI